MYWENRKGVSFDITGVSLLLSEIITVNELYVANKLILFINMDHGISQIQIHESVWQYLHWLLHSLRDTRFREPLWQWSQKEKDSHIQMWPKASRVCRCFGKTPDPSLWSHSAAWLPSQSGSGIWRQGSPCQPSSIQIRILHVSIVPQTHNALWGLTSVSYLLYYCWEKTQWPRQLLK